MQHSDEPWSLRPEDFPASGTPEDKLRFLVRYAVLAPSFRTSSPGASRSARGVIGLYADLSRRQLAAVQPARPLRQPGLRPGEPDPGGDALRLRPRDRLLPMCEKTSWVAQIRLSARDPEVALREPLLDAITRRRTQHGAYASRPIDPASLGELRACCRDPACPCAFAGRIDSAAVAKRCRAPTRSPSATPSI